MADSNYVRFPSPRLDPKKTVFVGALHGMINAQVNQGLFIYLVLKTGNLVLSSVLLGFSIFSVEPQLPSWDGHTAIQSDRVG